MDKISNTGFKCKKRGKCPGLFQLLIFFASFIVKMNDVMLICDAISRVVSMEKKKANLIAGSHKLSLLRSA